MSDQVKYLLEENEMPTACYNVQADFATPLPVIETAVNSLRNDRTHYTPSLGELPLRTAIAAQYTKTTGQPFTAQNVADTVQAVLAGRRA